LLDLSLAGSLEKDLSANQSAFDILREQVPI